MIKIKSEREINIIKEGCKIWIEVKKQITEFAKIGTKLIDIDNFAGHLIKKHNATPTFLGYHGYPANICISVNDVLIHGIGSEQVLTDGDIVTFDIGVNFKGYNTDAAFTLEIGNVSEAAKTINKVTYDCLMESIKIIKPGTTTGDIGNKINEIAVKGGYQVIKDFSGHGCGKDLHEDPIIPNYGKKGEGAILEPGMVICIEPMLLTSSDKYTIDNDGWTVKSFDKKLTCHWEHMVHVTSNGYEILTLEEIADGK